MLCVWVGGWVGVVCECVGGWVDGCGCVCKGIYEEKKQGRKEERKKMTETVKEGGSGGRR